MHAPQAPRLAYGRTAEILAWGDGRVLKLFQPWMTLAAIRHEHAVARAVHGAGVPSPAVGDLVTVDDRHGIEYERIEGPSLLEMLRSEPERIALHAGVLADLQRRVHEVGAIPGIPSQRDRLEQRIHQATGIDAAGKDRLLTRMRGIPQEARLCHGDLHPGNVLLTEDGPILIDWLDAAIGNPACDVARTSLLMRGFLATTPDLDPAERSTLVAFHDHYLDRYGASMREVAEEVGLWRELVAAARLSEGIPELESWLVKEALQAG